MFMFHLNIYIKKKKLLRKYILFLGLKGTMHRLHCDIILLKIKYSYFTINIYIFFFIAIKFQYLNSFCLKAKWITKTQDTRLKRYLYFCSFTEKKHFVFKDTFVLWPWLMRKAEPDFTKCNMFLEQHCY